MKEGSQQIFTYSKSTIETPEKGVKNVQSYTYLLELGLASDTVDLCPVDTGRKVNVHKTFRR